MTKQELRNSYLAKRRAKGDLEYSALNEKLFHNLFETLNLNKIKALHTFIPIIANKEPDTWLLIQHIRNHHPRVRIIIPKVLDSTRMIHFVLTDDLPMIPNTWGIPEPENGETIQVDDIDVVIVPLVVADQYGNRVGYGKGFYDRFLSECRTDCIRIGLSFFDPVESIDDIDPFDKQLHQLVTPDRVFQFDVN